MSVTHGVKPRSQSTPIVAYVGMMRRICRFSPSIDSTNVLATVAVHRTVYYSRSVSPD